jgi:uncharacterized membrane protein YhfC
MKRHLLLLCIALAFLTACSSQSAATQSNIDKGAYLTGAKLNETSPGQSKTGFLIKVSRDGDPMGILLRGNATQGSIYAVVLDQAGNAAWKSAPASGVFSKNNTVTSLKAGDYELAVAWDGPLSVDYDIFFVPGGVVLPVLSPLALIGGTGMMLVALGFIIYAAIRRLGWGYLGIGALAWVVTVAIKFVIAIPLNNPIYKLLVVPGKPGIGDAAFNLYVGSLTGWTEVLLVWLLVRYTRVGKVGWGKALAFGIGFGAVEALLLGVSSFTTILMGLISPNLIPAGTLGELAVANNLAISLAPIWERFFTVLVHIFSNVLIFYAASVRKPGYFWLAFLLKTLLDAAASYGQLTGLKTILQIWSLEALVGLFGVFSWIGIRWVESKYHKPQMNADQRGSEKIPI